MGAVARPRAVAAAARLAALSRRHGRGMCAPRVAGRNASVRWTACSRPSSAIGGAELAAEIHFGGGQGLVASRSLWLSPEPLMLLPVLANAARSYTLALDARRSSPTASLRRASRSPRTALRSGSTSQRRRGTRPRGVDVGVGLAVSGVVFYVWLQLLNSMFPRAATSVLQLAGKVPFTSSSCRR